MDGVISKNLRNKYIQELDDRYEALRHVLNSATALISSSHGCKKGRKWINPNDHCTVDTTTLKFALGDFKTVISELGKIK